MTSTVIGDGLTLEVRRTHPADPALLALSDLATSELGTPLADGSLPRGVEAYRWLVSLASGESGATSIGIVASLNGGAVGMGIVVRGTSSFLLHGVFVAPAFRGIGVGRALVLESREVASGSVVRTLALPGDRRTKNLFEQAGMPAQLIVAG